MPVDYRHQRQIFCGVLRNKQEGIKSDIWQCLKVDIFQEKIQLCGDVLHMGENGIPWDHKNDE